MVKYSLPRFGQEGKKGIKEKDYHKHKQWATGSRVHPGASFYVFGFGLKNRKSMKNINPSTP